MTTPSEVLDRYVQAEAAYQAAVASFNADAGRIFKQVRLDRGWTLRDMAERLECDFTTLSKIERGHLVPGRPLITKLRWVLKSSND